MVKNSYECDTCAVNISKGEYAIVIQLYPQATGLVKENRANEQPRIISFGLPGYNHFCSIKCMSEKFEKVMKDRMVELMKT